MKLSRTMAIVILLGAAMFVTCSCFITRQISRTRQLARLRQWTGQPSHELHNLHTDNQTFSKSDGDMSTHEKISGFHANSSLLTQPFAPAFAHTPDGFAQPMPEDSEIASSTFATVPNGQTPWKEGYKDESRGWSNHKNEELFDVYDDPFAYNKVTGEVTAAGVERKDEVPLSERTKKAKEQGVDVEALGGLGVERTSGRDFEEAFMQ